MIHYLSTKMPFWRFVSTTGAISLFWLAPLLLLYVLGTPGFAAHLIAGGPALGRFLRQVATNGLPVVFAVNYVSFFIHAMRADRYGVARIPIHLILLDLPVRVLFFIGLHGLVYVLSAYWFGSFGGDRSQALRVVGPTLLRSALFDNLSGVYFYAIVLSALPLQIPALERLLATVRARWASQPQRPDTHAPRFPRLVRWVLFALSVAAMHAALLGVFAATIVLLQSA